jgi:hypothetical protein
MLSAAYRKLSQSDRAQEFLQACDAQANCDKDCICVTPKLIGGKPLTR